MARETTSKSIDGIADLVVIAPIKEGFINAYENITYATRLRIVAEALNRVRVSAREHELGVPFSDVTERILTLLDFRIGVLDKGLLALEGRGAGEPELRPRRYLYLTATFDTALEPYMRLIWDPLGPFLDLIFCNCEGYVTAGDHSCEEFLDWVRANQMDSAIFYATTGNTIRDDTYHGKIDRLLRDVKSGPGELEVLRARELDVVRAIAPNPDTEASKIRRQALIEAMAGKPETNVKVVKLNELALEVLTVLYRLADFYPPEWQFNKPLGSSAPPLTEGKYLARVAYSILQGWSPKMLKGETPKLFKEPLAWYERAAGKLADGSIPNKLGRATRPDPAFDPSEVQGGILTALDQTGDPVRHGALLLFSITERHTARRFLASLPVHFEGDPPPASGLYLTMAFTCEGLRRLGLDQAVIDALPKEFREGMAARAGLIGDLRENHPRRWTLPRRCWPEKAKVPPPPVDLTEIDLALQLRYAPPAGSDPNDTSPLEAEITRLGAAAAAAGLVLVACETMGRLPHSGDPARFQDHFGFTDGISQPDVQGAEAPGAPDLFETITPPDPWNAGVPLAKRWNNKARLGEVVSGYRNNRMDHAGEIKPITPRKDYGDWQAWPKNAARQLMFGGSFLVVRKLRQQVGEFDRVLEQEAARLRDQDGLSIDAEQLAWQIIGRRRDGSPLVQAGTGPNDFTFERDDQGSACPFAAHIRRANPRNFEHGRPAPRIVRRGMSFGPLHDPGDPASANAPRGLMFMCYQSSIAEQFEVIQRWLNGGNSTGIASSHGDPLLGIGPKADALGFGGPHGQPRLFQFEWQGRVARVAFPRPFVSLDWGLYLLTPSRRALAMLCEQSDEGRAVMTDQPIDFAELRENRGRTAIGRAANLPAEAAALEWKRLLEDIDAKDPFELSQTPDIWSSIRWYGGGALRLQTQQTVVTTLRDMPYKDVQPLWAKLGKLLKIGSAALREDAASTAFNQAEVAADASADASANEAEKQPTVLVASPYHVRRVLSDWKRYSVDEQLHRIEQTSGAIYVTQQPDDIYKKYPELNHKYNYRKEALATNQILLAYDEADGFADGYGPATAILAAARAEAAKVPVAPPLDYFKLELRRQFLMPALGAVCSKWFGIPGPPGDTPDPEGLNKIMLNGGWNWDTATKADDPKGETLRTAQCPGDCLSPSRGAFYPRPTPSITAYAHDHGPAIRKAGKMFIDKYWDSGRPPPGDVASAMFAAMDDKAAVSRNLIGIMVGAMPPMDGNLRGILVEWLGERTLWRHQAAYLRKRAAGMAPFEAARAALWRPMTRAMCKRPAPDLIYRQANRDDVLKPNPKSKSKAQPTAVKEGDLVIVSLVGAAQESLRDGDQDGDVSIIFGGDRKAAWQGDYKSGCRRHEIADPVHPVHACPAQKMAMGAMLGILAALFDAGRIEALPASLIVKIKNLPAP